MEQGNSANKPPDVGDQKALINVKDASCSIMMVSPTEDWYDPPFPGIMFWKTSTQEVPQTDPRNNKTKKGNASTIHVGNIILDATA